MTSPALPHSPEHNSHTPSPIQLNMREEPAGQWSAMHEGNEGMLSDWAGDLVLG